MIGRSISHYHILRRLGAGGMGEVYEAEDTDLHRKVAVKILPQYLASNPEALDRFQREARALAALNHPNIVTIYSVEERDKTHFLAMELVQGRPLNDLIPRGGFDMEKLLALGIPLTDALAAAHARGIGHRDLKASNVMVNDEGRLKVIDFGLAKLLHRETGPTDVTAPILHQTLDGQILGTPAYMAPEQIEGRKVDHRTDIFALGILLFEMATAQRPFKGDSPISVMSSILRDPPRALAELNPNLPEPLGRLVRRCLEKNPNERYQSALDVRDALKALEEQVKTARRAGLAARSELPPAATRAIRPNNLPAELTSFVGRERETADVSRLIGGDAGEPSGTRLLTLIGAGGTGKTRLALHVAAGLIERFRDGVWLVELASLGDPSLVPQTAASAVGLRHESSCPPRELLTRFLAPKQALLVLDNCEHLVEACATLAEALLRACPGLRILATSREGLRLAGETTWVVPGLSMPSLADGRFGSNSLGALGQYESIKLFVERAKALTPAFSLNDQNIAAVAQLCHRLDGIPLAIELAAARTRLLPVEQLLERVQDRFRLLTGGSRNALPRQQTLRALVDWSYDLLSGRERLLFDRLSVFAGGWTLEAAEAVCADEDRGKEMNDQSPMASLRSEDVLDLLGHLLEKSMVVGERSIGGAARYRLLETLRQYGQERLATASEASTNSLRERHAIYFIALAERVALAMRGPDQVNWSDRFDLEHDNIRAGLEWGKAADAPPERVELGLRLAGPLYAPWFRQGYGREVRQHFETLLSHRHGQRPTRARAQALFGLGSLALWQDGDHATAWTLLNESLSVAGKLGDTTIMAGARHNLGLVLSSRGDKEGARRLHEEALQLARADGDLYGVRWSLEDLGDLADSEGDTQRATELYEEALSLARQAGDQHGIGSTLRSMGALARAAGKPERARELVSEGLSIMLRIGCKHCCALCLNDLALAASASGDQRRAVRLLGAADALRERTGIVIPAAFLGAIEQSLAEARCRLGEAVYTAAWNEGRGMSLTQANA